jgi:plastocyanin
MGNARLSASMAVFVVLLTAVWAIGDVIVKQDTDAQMMDAVGMGNMSSGGMMTMKPDGNMIMTGGKNITSSINLMNIINQAIGSRVNVSLSEAATAAEGISNNSRVVAAYLGEENGYLVYNVMVIDPSMNFSKAIVDPGNGHLLFSKQLSKEDMMKDEMERHHKMMSMMMGIGEHDMMMGGPQHDMGMMMGPMNQGMMMGERGERNMTMGPGMMTGGHQQGRGMMMGPMLAQAQQTDNITSSNATSVPPTTTTVSMAQGSQSPNNPEFFVPAEITAKPGETIIWKNDDSTIHTATSGQGATPDGRFDTSFVPPGQSSKPTAMPTQLGQYPYFCTLHPWMTGIVTVG